ncbi:MAG: hypothetical protein Q9M43_10090 [Sulfurimonas sp.]|nr:hypothetical protein [Sulfurimonas sp.]
MHKSSKTHSLVIFTAGIEYFIDEDIFNSSSIVFLSIVATDTEI